MAVVAADARGLAAAAEQQLVAHAPALRLKRDWLAMHSRALEAAPSEAVATDLLLNYFAASDLRDTCEGSLPPGLARLHNVQIEGAHVLQLLQAVDISQPLGASGEEGAPADDAPDDFAFPGFEGAGRQQQQQQPVRRGPKMLKVCLTDGAQAVCGIERRPIAALRHARPGSKLVLGNKPLLRRGLLLLEPQNLEVLGPQPPSLDAGAGGGGGCAVQRTSQAAPAPVPIVVSSETGGGLGGMRPMAAPSQMGPSPATSTVSQVPAARRVEMGHAPPQGVGLAVSAALHASSAAPPLAPGSVPVLALSSGFQAPGSGNGLISTALTGAQPTAPRSGTTASARSPGGQSMMAGFSAPPSTMPSAASAVAPEHAGEVHVDFGLRPQPSPFGVADASSAPAAEEKPVHPLEQLLATPSVAGGQLRGGTEFASEMPERQPPHLSGGPLADDDLLKELDEVLAGPNEGPGAEPGFLEQRAQRAWHEQRDLVIDCDD